MNTCACAPSSRTSVAFAHGIVMQRCRVHELQTWTQHGRAADDQSVRRLLKDLFVETRGVRSAPPRSRAAVHASSLQGSPSRPVSLGTDMSTEAALNALLRSRGLQGAWAVA